MKATELRHKVVRYVQHRERLMHFYGAWKTTERMAAIAAIHNQLEHFKHHGLVSQCRLILRLLPDLRSIAAGESSKYYHSDQEKLAQFERCATTYLSANGMGRGAGDTQGKVTEPAPSFFPLQCSPL